MKRWATFLASVMLSGIAIGNITVTITPSDGSTGGGTYSSGSNIAIATNYSGGGYSEVTISILGATTDSIGDLTVVATSNIPAKVIAKSGVNSSLIAIGSIDTGGSTALVTLGEIRATTIGTVHAGYVYFMYGTGTIGAITSDTDIYDVVSGGFRGDVLAESGAIYQLCCSAGTVGTSGSPISIRAANAVGYVLGTSVYADISGPTGDLFAPAIGRVQTSSGPFVGSIRGPALTAQRQPSPRDQDHRIGLLDPRRTDHRHRWPPAGPGKLSRNPGRIRPPGLWATGQIIINASDASEVWTAPVKIDGITIDDGATQPGDAPYYEALSSSLGGGAIGLVPFNLHKTDCLPAHAPAGSCEPFETRVWPDEIERQTIVLRHYGPVFDSLDNDPKPVIIDLKSVVLCSPTPCPGAYGVLTEWTDETDHFDVYIPPGGREVWVARELSGGEAQSLDIGYSFKIDPAETSGVTQLRSAGTFLSDEDAPNVAGYPYILDQWCESLMGPRPPEEQ